VPVFDDYRPSAELLTAAVWASFVGLNTFERVFSQAHSNVADVLETMAQLYHKTGNITEAEKLAERIEKIRSHKQVALGPL